MTIRFVRFDRQFEDEPELLEQVCAAILWPREPKTSDGKLGYWNAFLCDLDKIPHGLAYRVDDDQPNAPMFLEALEKRTDTTVVNQRVNVAVPNIGLMQMTKVQVFEDYCTEQLQDRLDEGWRILAICPQPDQRRPDYVLGKAVREDES